MRFRITWAEGQYKVSVPRYEGGEVVTAEYHEQRVKELEQLLDAERSNANYWQLASQRERLLRSAGKVSTKRTK